MAKLGKILETQFKKLGIEITDEVKDLIALENEVPDETAVKIDRGLITIESAKTNPDVIKVLKQSTLAGIDAKIDDIIKEMGVTVDEDFANEKNSYEKVAKLSKILHEAGKKKGEGNSKEGLSEAVKKEREEWVKQQGELQGKLKDITELLAAKETAFTTTRESDLTSFELQKILLGKDYVFPKDMDSSLKVQTALGALNKDLANRGLVIKRNEAGSLVITDSKGEKAYNEKHEPIDNPNHYIDSVLSSNKLLNVNDPNAQSDNQRSPGNGNLNGGGGNKNAAVLNEIDAQMQSLGM